MISRSAVSSGESFYSDSAKRRLPRLSYLIRSETKLISTLGSVIFSGGLFEVIVSYGKGSAVLKTLYKEAGANLRQGGISRHPQPGILPALHFIHSLTPC